MFQVFSLWSACSTIRKWSHEKSFGLNGHFVFFLGVDSPDSFVIVSSSVIAFLCPVPCFLFGGKVLVTAFICICISGWLAAVELCSGLATRREPFPSPAWLLCCVMLLLLFVLVFCCFVVVGGVFFLRQYSLGNPGYPGTVSVDWDGLNSELCLPLPPKCWRMLD